MDIPKWEKQGAHIWNINNTQSISTLLPKSKVKLSSTRNLPSSSAFLRSSAAMMTTLVVPSPTYKC